MATVEIDEQALRILLNCIDLDKAKGGDYDEVANAVAVAMEALEPHDPSSAWEDEFKWMCLNEHGDILFSVAAPSLVEWEMGGGTWFEWFSASDFVLGGRVNLCGADWKNTRRELKP